jgi:hypothetical protein
MQNAVSSPLTSSINPPGKKAHSKNAAPLHPRSSAAFSLLPQRKLGALAGATDKSDKWILLFPKQVGNARNVTISVSDEQIEAFF